MYKGSFGLIKHSERNVAKIDFATQLRHDIFALYETTS
jgi:hypothetical protein